MNAYSLRDLIYYFLRLGSLGWGGPVALVGYMHRDLVESRKWISEEDYREGLALAQLAPGPLAAQLAIYIGYVHFRIMGATLVGFAFVLPSFIIVVLLGIAYVAYGGLPWMQAVFYGVGASVIGIIALSGYRLASKSVGKDPWLWGIFLVLAVTTFITETEIIWLILASGFLLFVVKSWPPFLMQRSHAIAPILTQLPVISSDHILLKIALFFGAAGAFVFGSGLAIVPFLYGGVVHEYGWLNEQQFVDAVAVAMITPGPVVITVGFIGYLVAGFPGACVASLATFLPCYLFTILPAPYFKKYGKNPGLKTFVDGVTIAAFGAIAGAVLVLGKRTLTDWPSVLIAISSIALLLSFKKVKEPWLIAGAAAIGLLIKLI